MPRSTIYMLKVVAPIFFAVGLPFVVITYYLGFNISAILHGAKAVLTLGGVR